MKTVWRRSVRTPISEHRALGTTASRISRRRSRQRKYVSGGQGSPRNRQLNEKRNRPNPSILLRERKSVAVQREWTYFLRHDYRGSKMEKTLARDLQLIGERRGRTNKVHHVRKNANSQKRTKKGMWTPNMRVRKVWEFLSLGKWECGKRQLSRFGPVLAVNKENRP